MVDNVQNLGRTDSRKQVPFMRQAFDLARRNQVCVQVKADNEYADLLEHRYVHAQIIGTDVNKDAVLVQNVTDKTDWNFAATDADDTTAETQM